MLEALLLTNDFYKSWHFNFYFKKGHDQIKKRGGRHVNEKRQNETSKGEVKESLRMIWNYFNYYTYSNRVTADDCRIIDFYLGGGVHNGDTQCYS